MKTIIKLLFTSLIIFGFTACTPKVTVKSLYSSSMHNESLHVLYIDDFKNDRIFQKQKIEEKLSQMILEQKKVFKLKDSLSNVDAIIKGSVLESSLTYDIYHKKSLDKRCRLYKYNEKTKVKECVKYEYKFIPCEDRKYKVKTKIKVINTRSDSILFSKIYEKTKNVNKCFDSYNYAFDNFSRNKYEINSKLADEIAYELVDDISPHYKYFNLEIVEEFENTHDYTTSQIQKLENIAQLIEEKHFNLAQNKLHKLNTQLNNSSWEVLYNLALSYEAQNKLYEARKYYKKALYKTNSNENLVFIKNAINRVETNLEEKIKAKSQLP